MFQCNVIKTWQTCCTLKNTPDGAHFDIAMTANSIPVFHLDQTSSTFLMSMRRPSTMRALLRALSIFVGWTLFFALQSHNGNISLKRNETEPCVLACFHSHFMHSYPRIIMAVVVKSNVKCFLLHLSRTAYLTVPLELTFTRQRVLKVSTRSPILIYQLLVHQKLSILF